MNTIKETTKGVRHAELTVKIGIQLSRTYLFHLFHRRKYSILYIKILCYTQQKYIYTIFTHHLDLS